MLNEKNWFCFVVEKPDVPIKAEIKSKTREVSQKSQSFYDLSSKN